MSCYVEIGLLLAAGITMKQIAAMEVTHTGHVLKQQEWAVQTG